MEKFWFILLALALLLGFGYLFFRIIRGFVREKFGPNWLKVWANKLYFWQSVIFMSCACTVVILYLMKMGNMMNF